MFFYWEYLLIWDIFWCIAAKFWITAFSGPATCRTGPIRQLAGPDRSEDNLSRSDGQTSCLLSDQLYHQVPIQINISMNELAVDNINSFITRCPSQCLKRGLMTRKYSPCWIQLNSDKRLLFAVENKKKHHVIWPTINKKVSTLADLKLHYDLKFGHWLPLS